MSFPRLTGLTFGKDGRTWDGETGRVFKKSKEVFPSGKVQWVVMTVDALALVYPSLRDKVPQTVIFLTPSSLARHYKCMEPRPPTIPVNMIRRSFLNLADAEDEKAEMFYQEGGTRRYVP